MEVTLLGSTGSIGTQTLQVLRSLGRKPVCLTAGRNTILMERQSREFNPALVVMSDQSAANDLRVRLSDTGIRVAGGPEALIEAATLPEADIVLTAVVGMAGLAPTLAAIDAGKNIALANKETLVCAGTHVMARAAEKGVKILPVDSEHSAVFQCLEACRDKEEVSRIWLTASGGPFFGWNAERLANVTPEQAVKHPNWSMGKKISVDSATMLNKGLECIEAAHLFDVDADGIGVVIHRESIVHSLVEFRDGALLAQCGVPDMRLPIQYALTYPNRLPCPVPKLDMSKMMTWGFAPPDTEAFPCLKLAFDAMRRGDAACCALNAADEAAVELFLDGRIGFTDIPKLLEIGINSVSGHTADNLSDLLQVDLATRAVVRQAAGTLPRVISKP